MHAARVLSRSTRLISSRHMCIPQWLLCTHETAAAIYAQCWKLKQACWLRVKLPVIGTQMLSAALCW